MNMKLMITQKRIQGCFRGMVPVAGDYQERLHARLGGMRIREVVGSKKQGTLVWLNYHMPEGQEWPRR